MRRRTRRDRYAAAPLPVGHRVGVWLPRASGGRLGNKARGLPDDPQWFRILRATDTAGVDLRDQHHDVAVRVLEGEERDDAFAQVLRENPSFGAYEGKAGRPMPVAHLTPR